MSRFLKVYKKYKKSEVNLFVFALRLVYYRVFFDKLLLMHQSTVIKGVKNIEIKGKLEIGTKYLGFVQKKDITYLNIRGRMIVKGKFSIGRGCRLDIGENATVELGNDSYINPFTMLIINHWLKIGDGCSISWNCQFLDDDFHNIYCEDKKDKRDNAITIGNNVWIGCNVYIYKGTVIPDGCVIAANSVVRGVFMKSNSLIAGNPAKVVKENISWG